MINFEDLEFLIKQPVLPINSIVDMTISVKCIIENGDFLALENEVFRILESDEKEKSFSAIPEFKKQDLKKFIENECDLSIQELDEFSEFAEATFKVTMPYYRLSKLTDEDIKNIKKLKVTCSFGSFEII